MSQLRMAVMEWLGYLLPQTRWAKYTAICREEDISWTEERLVLYRAWLGRQWDYMEIITNSTDYERTINRIKDQEGIAHGTTQR